MPALLRSLCRPIILQYCEDMVQKWRWFSHLVNSSEVKMARKMYGQRKIMRVCSADV